MIGRGSRWVVALEEPLTTNNGAFHGLTYLSLGTNDEFPWSGHHLSMSKRVWRHVRVPTQRPGALDGVRAEVESNSSTTIYSFTPSGCLLFHDLYLKGYPEPPLY